MKLLISESMPQLINPISIQEITSIRTKILNLLESLKLNPEATYKGADVFQLKDPRDDSEFVVLMKDKEILYFVRHKPVKLSDKLVAGRQVLVWNNSVSPLSVGFAAHVFFNILLVKYKRLVSDKQQSDKGRRFWYFVINKAFEKEHNVYKVDMNLRKIDKVSSEEELLTYAEELWGTHSDFMQKLVVVSLDELKT